MSQTAKAKEEPEFVPKPLESVSWLKSVLVLSAALLIVPLFAFAPWLIFNLVDPSKKLPVIFVRPSLGGQSQYCRNFDDVQVPDPYTRSAQFRDPPFQKLKYCEDAEFISELGTSGVSLITCDSGRHEWNTVMGTLKNPKPRGALWIFDQEVRDGVPSIVKLPDYPEYLDFHPLGTSSFTQDGVTTLFVVNHGRAYTSIEVFNLSKVAGDWTANYLRTVAHPLGTHSANSIVALSPTSLLVTNDHLFAHRAPVESSLVASLKPTFGLKFASYLAPILRKASLSIILAKVETFLGLPLSWVAHVEWKGPKQVPVEGTADDETQQAADFAIATESVSAKVVAKGLSFANGIALSPKGNLLAVAATTYPGIYLYNVSRDALGKPELSFYTKFNTPFGVDNINFSPIQGQHDTEADLFNGANLIAAGHPYSIKLVKMARNPEQTTAPSWIMSVEPSSRKPFAPGDVVKQSAERDGAPLPIAKRALSTLRKWDMKTLYQSNGDQVEVVKVDREGNQLEVRKVGVASSSTGIYDPNSGFLLVTGLYSGVMACENVGLP